LLQGSGSLVEESAFCGMLNVPDNFPLYETSSVVFFLLPMVILVVLYTRMGLLITRRHGLGESHRTNNSRKSILRMLGKWPSHNSISCRQRDAVFFLEINSGG
jgi:neuromedin U receptor 1